MGGKEALLALFLNTDIPPAHLEGINAIEYSEPRAGADEGYDGGYCRETRSIYFYRRYVAAVMQQILSHEIGHHQCYEHEHPNIFGTGDLGFDSGDFVSQRARLNPKEDCAETYRAFYETDVCKPWIERTRTLTRKCLEIRKWHNSNVKKPFNN